jgi:hypothetical protein
MQNNNISFVYYQNFLITKNKYAHISLDVLNFKNTNTFFIFTPTSLYLFVGGYSKSNLILKKKISSIVKGVSNFFYKKLSLFGVGFRVWVTINSYFVKNLMIKIGFSKTVLLEIQKEIVIFCVRPTLIIVKGPSKEVTNCVASRIRFLKRSNVYKSKGILNENEFIQLKPGKK